MNHIAQLFFVYAKSVYIPSIDCNFEYWQKVARMFSTLRI